MSNEAYNPEEAAKKVLERILKQGMRPNQRIVSPKVYDVLLSMVTDGLISGLPYSEFKSDETLAEFIKRLEA